jgi:threonine dehydratase
VVDPAVSAYTAWQGEGLARASARVPLADIVIAQERIGGLAARTPVKRSFALGERIGVRAFLKLETLQPTGAFKVRGAANRLLALRDDERRAGVITVSTGNHGRAVAYVARELGIRCVVCLSELVPQNKVDAIVACGAQVDVGGIDQDAAFVRARARATAEGLLMVDPFDDPYVIAGQGTLGLELLNDVPDVGTVLLPLSGGGLAAGVAAACKASRPGIRIVAIASERCPAMLRSLQAGKPIDVPEHRSLADSLGGGIGLENRYTFDMVRELIDEIQVVSDAEIAAALRFAFREERLVLEGAAAVPIAALLRAERGEFPPPVVAVLTGDNIDPQRLIAILQA